MTDSTDLHPLIPPRQLSRRPSSLCIRLIPDTSRPELVIDDFRQFVALAAENNPFVQRVLGVVERNGDRVARGT